MAIVSESFSSANRAITSRTTPGATIVVPYPPAVQKTQKGFRSGPLSKEERLAFSRIPQNLANEQKLIFALEAEDLTYARKPARAFMVHDRDYTEIHSECGVFYADYLSVEQTTRLPIRQLYSQTGSIGLMGKYVFPSTPSSAQISGYAGELMRLSAPAQPAVNLTRVIGELRDAHRIFRAANYNPRTAKELGGSYLNYVFGISPTTSDLSRVAETVLRLDPIIGRYVRSERHRLRRSRKRELFRDSNSGTFSLRGNLATNATNYRDYTLDGRGINIRVSNCNIGVRDSTQDIIAADFSWSYTATQTVRSFATFEYFIPEPSGLDGRLGKYRHLAKAALGGGLDAPTAYDLTPWTWVADWFVDIGGLLHYQQAVADNQMITSLSGSSYYEEVKAIISFSGVRNVVSTASAKYVANVLRAPAAVSTFHQVYHRRRSGSPYAISPTWDLSTQQWAIAAAMGLSRSNGVPIIG